MAKSKRMVPYTGREVWMDPTTTFTRQEVAERAGLSDDILSFWSKRRLIIPVDGGGGKGSHRRFDAAQVNIAAILAVYREKFGANIGLLSSLSDLLQRSVATFRKVPNLPIAEWEKAARIADKLDAFRSGRPVMVRAHDYDDPGYDELDIEEQLKERPAATEAEVLASVDMSDCPTGVLIRAAAVIGPGKTVEAQVASVIEGVLMDPENVGNVFWLIAQTDTGWDLKWATDEIHFSLEDADALEPALFIPIGPILRRIWSIPHWRELRARRYVADALGKIAKADLEASVCVSDRNDCDLLVEAPEKDHGAIVALLKSHRYYFELRDPSWPIEAKE